MTFFACSALCYAFLLGSFAQAQVGFGPQQLPLPPAVEPPQDVPYKGMIRIAVDATDTAHKVYRVQETVPVLQSGPMVLLYPKWESGSHAATGPIASLAGLFIRGEGRALAWQRDPVDVFAFHVDVPADVTVLEIDFQYLSPIGSRGSAASMSADLVIIPWQYLMLYPAGYYVRDLPVRATLRLPAAFYQASSLERVSTSSDRTEYKLTTVERLADSPVYAGRYFKAIELGPAGSARVTLDLFGDTPDDLRASDSHWRA